MIFLSTRRHCCWYALQHHNKCIHLYCGCRQYSTPSLLLEVNNFRVYIMGSNQNGKLTSQSDGEWQCSGEEKTIERERGKHNSEHGIGSRARIIKKRKQMPVKIEAKIRSTKTELTHTLIRMCAHRQRKIKMN